jgi:hypothetical protein
MCLWEFSWNFCDFRSIFRVFKQFLEFFWNCFHIKNNFEKNNKSYLTGPSPKARPRSAPAQPPGPAGPIQPPARGRVGHDWGRRRCRLGREHPGLLRPRPIKATGTAACVPCPPAQKRRRPPEASAAAAEPSAARRRR